METGATDVCKRNEETALCNTRNPSRHTPNNEDEPVELCPIVEAEAGQDFIAEDESQQEEKEDDDGDGEVSDKGADKNAAEDEAEVEASQRRSSQLYRIPRRSSPSHHYIRSESSKTTL
jgi:hypothetical protein